MPGMPFMPTFEEPEDNETWDVDERVFPNGRMIQAIHEQVVEIEDASGRKRLRRERRANADCGCDAQLKDLYLCFNPNCQKIVCFRHCNGPCAACNALTLCWQCIVAVVDPPAKPEHKAVQLETPLPVLMCKNCFAVLAMPAWKRVVLRFWSWLKG